MKFVHIADFHFDTSFSQINDSNLGVLRKTEQRKVLKKIIDFIEEYNIECLFIAGDFYEHKYIKESTIEYINNQFKRIENTQIFITPGNHDPYVKNSFYNKYTWNNNVHIFGPEISKYKLGDVNIYGCGFDDFYYSNPQIENFEIENKNEVNIFITHGSLDGGYDDKRVYNPMSSSKMRQLGFDYVALGHIHKANYEEEKNIIYPGSTISMGFDELGKHGMIVGDISKGDLKIEFVPVDESEFVVENLDVSSLFSMEDLVSEISTMNIDENNYYEIYLVGKRNFDIDMYNLRKLIESPRIIKVKDKTEINRDLNSLINENTLKGLYVKEIMERLQNCGDDEQKVLEDALEIGLNILEK